MKRSYSRVIRKKLPKLPRGYKYEAIPQETTRVALDCVMELAMVRAIPDMIVGELKPCRIKGLYGRLKKEVDKELVEVEWLDASQIEEIRKRIEKFGKATGWLGKQKHVGTILSFCIELIESSTHKHNPKIIEVLNDIAQHMENQGDLKVICCWAGTRAIQKWKEAVECKL